MRDGVPHGLCAGVLGVGGACAEAGRFVGRILRRVAQRRDDTVLCDGAATSTSGCCRLIDGRDKVIFCSRCQVVQVSDLVADRLPALHLGRCVDVIVRLWPGLHVKLGRVFGVAHAVGLRHVGVYHQRPGPEEQLVWHICHIGPVRSFHGGAQCLGITVCKLYFRACLEAGTVDLSARVPLPQLSAADKLKHIVLLSHFQRPRAYILTAALINALVGRTSATCPQFVFDPALYPAGQHPVVELRITLICTFGLSTNSIG